MICIDFYIKVFERNIFQKEKFLSKISHKISLSLILNSTDFKAFLTTISKLQVLVLVIRIVCEPIFADLGEIVAYLLMKSCKS